MSSEPIEISIIIPTYNRGTRLIPCLSALTKQTVPSSAFEVVVVVDGSTDNTIEILQNFSPSFQLNIIQQENSGQNIARNKGALAAKGIYCLFIDDDIIADPDLVAEHLKVQRENDGVVGIGQIKMLLPEKADRFTRCYAAGWAEHYDTLSHGIPPTWIDLYGGNFSIPREIFLKSEGFAQDLRRSHDIELGYRLEQMGILFKYIHSAVGIQDEHKRTRELMADAEKAGAAWVNLYQRHPPVLPDLLGYFCDAGKKEVWLRRFFLALGIPPYLLKFLGPLFISKYRINKWHRFILSYCYWRGVRKAIPNQETWKRLTHGVRILAYHAISGPGEQSSAYILAARRFEKQMAWLKKMKYPVLSMEEYLNYRRSYQLPPAHSVIITFDDGYADNRKYAYPILRRYNFPATIFLVLDKINQTNDWARDTELSGRPLLSWPEIYEMHQDGIGFGIHSRTHVSLTSASNEQICAEIEGTRVELEQKLRTPVRFFAFPFGEYDGRVIEIVKNGGFEASLSIDEGVNTPNTPLHRLRRKMVLGTESMIAFILNLL
jgi:glycosyltransferase involved in cell wall biosynthesis/peptidoglycan/xylan/chitin deacetylase (PgdA/CDA1 family)